MARILYGVAGEGFGHSSRSETVASLLEKDHEILFAGSRNSYKYLKKQGKKVIKTYGYFFAFRKNKKIDSIKTILQNTQELSTKGLPLIAKLVNQAKEFNPDIVITDFEPFTAVTAKLLGKKLISLDHQNVITRTKIEYPTKFSTDYASAKIVTENMITDADHYFVSSFFFPEVTRKKTTLVPPLVRKEILSQKIESNNYTLVYQSYLKKSSLLKTLQEIKGEKFIVYGVSKKEKVKGNLIFKPKSKQGFIKDLARAKAVITNGGYTLISEALQLKKPVLSVPFQGQFEQVLNAFYLDKLGYGKYYDELDDVKIIGFLNNLDKYQEKLDKINWNGNKKVTRELNSLIKKFCK